MLLLHCNTTEIELYMLGLFLDNTDQCAADMTHTRQYQNHCVRPVPQDGAKPHLSGLSLSKCSTLLTSSNKYKAIQTPVWARTSATSFIFQTSLFKPLWSLTWIVYIVYSKRQDMRVNYKMTRRKPKRLVYLQVCVPDWNPSRERKRVKGRCILRPHMTATNPVGHWRTGSSTFPPKGAFKSPP